MTDTVDTSKEAVERIAFDIKVVGGYAWSENARVASDTILALSAERDQLRREVEEARSVRGAAKVLLERENDQEIRDALGKVGITYSVLIHNAFQAISQQEPARP